MRQDDDKNQHTSSDQVSIPKIAKGSTAGKEHWIWIPKAKAQTKSTTHTVAYSKKEPPNKKKTFVAGKEDWVWQNKSKLTNQPTTHTANSNKESNTKSPMKKMQWVRKDRHAQLQKRPTASPKTKQDAKGVSQPQQVNTKWVWRPKQVNKPETTGTETQKQIWVPKTHVHHCENGFAWIRKDRQFLKHPTRPQRNNISKSTPKQKIWAPTNRQQLPQAATGPQPSQPTVNLVAIKDWMTFLRHQQGYVHLAAEPIQKTADQRPNR